MTAAFTLAHLSDPHLPPLPAARLRDLAGKRALGYLNWTRNRHKYHRREVLDALVADMQAQQPDHIAVTGDLVNLALEAEFAPAQAWLESVGTPQQVTVIPGNHDAYVRATRHRFAGTFGNYLRGDAGGRRRDVSVRAPARPAGADRRLLGGADAAADGDRPARPRAARCARPASGAIVGRGGLSGAAGASSPAFGFAHQAADRFQGAARGAEAARRRSDPARPRPHSFDDVVRGRRPADPRDRRAVGVGAGAPALSGRRL